MSRTVNESGKASFVDIGGEYEELPEIVDQEWVVENLKDEALGEAITLLRKRNQIDNWPELPEDEDPMFDSMAVGLDTLLKRRDLYEKAMAEVQNEINQFEGMARVGTWAGPSGGYGPRGTCDRHLRLGGESHRQVAGGRE